MAKVNFYCWNRKICSVMYGLRYRPLSFIQGSLFLNFILLRWFIKDNYQISVYSEYTINDIFQDGASKILHNHLRSSSNQESEPLSPRNVTSPTTNPMPRYRMSPNRSAMDEMETENMNPEEIYNSIKKTSADIQNLSKLDGHYDDPKKERDCTSQDSGIQSSMHDVRGESPDTKAADTTDSPRTNHRRQQQQHQYNPSYYQDDVSHSHRIFVGSILIFTFRDIVRVFFFFNSLMTLPIFLNVDILCR